MLILLYTQNVLLAQSIQNETKPLETILACSHARRIPNLIRLNKPSAVALDISNPLLEGPTLLKEIQRVNPKIPIIVMASHTQLELIESLFRWGAQSYLALPCHAARIMKRLREASDNISEEKKEPAWV